MANLSHYPTGWKVVETIIEKDAKGNDAKATRAVCCLSFTSHVDAIAYMRAAHPDVVIDLRCECCGKAKPLEPEAVGSTFMLNCAGCRAVPSTYSPPSDAEIGKPMKKPRPGLKETRADWLKATRRELAKFNLKSTGHETLDRALRLPDAPLVQPLDRVAMVAEDVPEQCQICDDDITTHVVDGVVRGAGWAFLCPACHKHEGIGLGTGRGQLYERQPDGSFLKVEG